jgi:hypothetical protein
MLQADVAAEPRAGGGVKLRIKAKTGEEFGVDLDRAKAAGLAAMLTDAPTAAPESSSEPKVEPSPDGEPIPETEHLPAARRNRRT